MGDLGGRPPKWKSPEEFEEAVDAYFANTETLHTWTGLAIHLGFESRQSLQDYKEKPGFSYPIKKALILIEKTYEERMFSLKNPTGPIFALKNFGWKDKQEIEQHITGDIKFGGIQIVKPNEPGKEPDLPAQPEL